MRAPDGASQEVESWGDTGSGEPLGRNIHAVGGKAVVNSMPASWGAGGERAKVRRQVTLGRSTEQVPCQANVPALDG